MCLLLHSQGQQLQGVDDDTDYNEASGHMITTEPYPLTEEGCEMWLKAEKAINWTI